MLRKRRPIAVVVCALGIAACDSGEHTLTGDVTAGAAAGFRTPGLPQARALDTRASLSPLLSVGDLLPGSDRPWAPVPDGLGLYEQDGRVVLLVNHELSCDGVDGRFKCARVSRLRLDPGSGHILAGDYPVDGSEGAQGLCSAFWADADSGWPSDGVLFTGEESAPYRQFVLDRAGRMTELPWLGRFAHENTVSIPGFNDATMLVASDDTKGRSELYLYRADSPADVLAGRGALYVLGSDAARIEALSPGDSMPAKWLPVPAEVSADAGSLQAWVDRQPEVLRFVRLEDVAPARSGGDPAVYFVDSGGSAGDRYGSVYRVRFDDTGQVGQVVLTLLARASGEPEQWASPDNIAVNERSLMLQEDPAFRPWLGRAARIYRFPLRADGGLGVPVPVVELNDPVCVINMPCWESSGIIDASAQFGPGTWLFTVQAHSQPVVTEQLRLPRENGQLLLLHLPDS